jgi:hypothetical protein
MGSDAPAAPRARRGPAIDLHWNLAQGDYAYLNYVPEEVEAYQKRVWALPGFWVESPSAAIEAGPEFSMKHAEELLEAMVELRGAATELPSDLLRLLLGGYWSAALEVMQCPCGQPEAARQDRGRRMDRTGSSEPYPKQRFATAARRSASLIMLLALAGCQFESSITPIAWITVPPQPFQQATLEPQVSPIPIAPTPIPPPPVFEGAESLDCAEAIGGDNHYGYCRIPGTNQFYVWGECAAACPAGDYPGIEIMTVAESETLRNFQDVVDIRDEQYAQREEGFIIGGGLGVLGIGGGAVGVIEACIVSGAFSFGWGCRLVLLAAGADLAITAWQFDRGFDADRRLSQPQGLDDSAQDLFDMFHGDQP